jgi:hypothetical protein
MKRTLLVGVLAGATVAVLCGPAGASSKGNTTAQTQYIKDVRFLDPTASGASNKEILKLGNEVCNDLKSGTSVKKLAGILKGTEKADLVEAADVLCPKYKAKVAHYYATLPTTTTTARPAPLVLYQQSGSGIESGAQFTVPASDKGWNEVWSYDCSNFGMAGNFATTINGYGSAALTNDSGTNQLGTSGSGTNHYYDTGTFSIDVNSLCHWTEEAVAVP